MKEALAVLLCATLAAPGCASAPYRPSSRVSHAGRSVVAPQDADRSVIVTFVRQLPVRTHIRVKLANGRTVRGTLMGLTDGKMVLQPRARIIEPAIEIPVDQIIGIEEEQASDRDGNVGKAIAVGVATGAATALGLFLLVLAVALGSD